METVLKAIADWIKGILTAGIMSNLSGLFDAVNEQVGDIAQQVGTRPSAFEPRVFAMIESLSRNVVLPIAGIILTFIACYELIEMITQHNNMAQFEPALIMRWIFKTAVSVWFISNTFDIVMAVFDLTQKVVSDSSGIIAGNTRVNEIGLSMLEASLMQMDVGPLFGLFLQSFFIGITMRILSIVIFVIVYGRMIEIYCMLIVQDQVWGRVTANRSSGKSTRYYMDEMHLLLKEEQTAAYSVEIWKRFRKWGGVPTGLTQNVKDLLSSREVENIFENSDMIIMLNQAAGDRQILAKQLNISPHQLSYVTHSGEGEGLLFFGNVILPFVDRFPTDLELYRIMTTKLGEVSEGKKE